MTDYEWEPDGYLEQMQAELPGYEELQDTVAAAIPVGKRFLELGTGTGETALRVLARMPGAAWVGIDASEAMLAQARERLPASVELRVTRLQDPLPEGSFDAVVSALAVHHLDGLEKRELFARVATAAPVFVLGDVVVPEQPEDAVIEIDGVYDTPSSVPEQLDWLREAGFRAEARLIRPDLAVFVARRYEPPHRPPPAHAPSAARVDEPPAIRDEVAKDTSPVRRYRRFRGRRDHGPALEGGGSRGLGPKSPVRKGQTPAALTTKSVAKPRRIPSNISHVTTTVWP